MRGWRGSRSAKRCRSLATGTAPTCSGCRRSCRALAGAESTLKKARALIRGDRRAAFEVAQDRAFGTIIAPALVGELLNGIPHGRHRGDLRRDIGDVIER